MLFSSTTADTYTFSDGTSFTKTGGSFGNTDITWSAPFTAWKTGQPLADDTTRGNQKCVRVDSNGVWDDVGCNGDKNYACQKAAA